MRRRELMVSKREGIKGSKAVAGDVCLYNKTTNELCIIPSNEITTETYPISNYSPVGVVVVPGTHNVYGDGSCAVISPKYMNYVNPDNGSYYESANYVKVSCETFKTNDKLYNCIGFVGKENEFNKYVIGTNSIGNLPIQDTEGNGMVALNGYHNPFDTDTYYSCRNYYYDNIHYNIPSPYNDDDTRNPAYYQTDSPRSTTNAMSDFDGVGNTQKMIACATAQSDWKTANSITNSSNGAYYPAACCCWRYHTDGTKQGDWYLPAIGELGYMMPKLRDIETSIRNLNTIYGNICSLISYSNAIHTSSTDYEHYNYVYDILFSDGYSECGKIDITSKNFTDLVRAFLRVK